MNRVLFLGNGLFRLLPREKDWAKMISDLASNLEHDYRSDLPLALEFDSIAMEMYSRFDYFRSKFDRPGYNDAFKQIMHEGDLVHGLKRYICGWFNERSRVVPTQLLAGLRLYPDILLTTNYDLRLDNIVSLYKSDSQEMMFFEGDKQSSQVPHVSYSDKPLPKVVHCHGSIERIDSICLGVSDYAASIREIDERYDELVSNASLYGQEGIESDYWAYRFLDSDIAIVGFGFSFQEVDLWHLLSLRKRYIPQLGLPANRITYYNLPPDGKSGLYQTNPALNAAFDDFDVEVINVLYLDGSYAEGYENAFWLIGDRWI